MATNAQLPLGLPTETPRTRARRAAAGERASKKRVTSFNMRAQDELVLDALRTTYGTQIAGEAIRRAMHEAARAHGIDVDRLDQEAAAA